MNHSGRQPVSRNPAVLLLGPTGSGKTPVGGQIEAAGLWGRECRHFDFGANLRAVVAAGKALPATPAGKIRGAAGFSGKEIEFLRDVLDRGLLLENEHFPLAERILQTFLASRGVDETTCIVLNGLPRHLGQARAMERAVDVRDVVVLQCAPESVLQRIESNVGGDRTRRTDDSPAAVAQKLALFAERTAPLVDHYRRAGARIHEIRVGPAMKPVQVWQALERRR